MRLQQVSALLLGSVIPPLSASAVPGHGTKQEVSSRFQTDAQKANAIKEAFQFTWTAYYKYAFPHDSLQPFDKSYEDDRNGWGATPVDALSTAIIMGNQETVNQILDFIPMIDFTKTAKDNDEISVFESTIRYLGGLLSAYDLLSGPKRNLVQDQYKIKPLLDQAVVLADGLKIAYDTPSGVPDGSVFFSPEHKRYGQDRNSIAGFGTMVLEWTRLSDLTGNPEYAELAQHAEEYLLNPKPATSEPFPGIVGHQVSTETGQFLDSTGGWGGGTDSFYEYLIKMYVYDPKEFARYKDRWVLAADSSMKHLASHPTTREDLTFLKRYSGKNTEPGSGHLDCFNGGNFILGGLVLNETKYVKFGLELANSCIQLYQQAPAGIGPEGFRWADSSEPESSLNSPPPAQHAEFYEKTGFWPTSSAYVLRPETLESVYHSYRATGDSRWQDLAWEAFEALNKTCRVETGGFAGITDIMKENGGGHFAKMESFWLAETLKYLYLTFAEDSEFQISSSGQNKWVFNTEAHPIRVRTK